MAHVASKNWELQQFDIETAFVNSEIDQEIYMEVLDIPDVLKDYVIKYIKENSNDADNQSLLKMLNCEKYSVLKLKKHYMDLSKHLESGSRNLVKF